MPSSSQSVTVPFSCLPHMLENNAWHIPDAPAVLAPGRNPLTYRLLYQQVKQVGHALRAAGIRRDDRVAVVLPNGPEMAVATLAVAASAVCAPINPAYGTSELNRYLADLHVQTLITTADIGSQARDAAYAHGVGVLELSVARDAPAGLFALSTGERSTGEVDPLPDEPADPGDLALLFLTSGTTSRPKIVPLTHANVCTSAYISCAAVALNETDRCLNVMPLFHGHGFIGVVMASLAAGASVVCMAGYDINTFFGCLTTFRPTWYSAVPTIHQAIVAGARHHREQLAACRLRFVRSGSSPLSPLALAELERTFDTSVINVYAMVETAAAPVASNPLPPRVRKAGSVGLPVGLDVAIMADDGTFLPVGETGQIVVRGASIMSRYDGDSPANQAAFAGDWFKTGDNGYFDGDGYLFLTGRVKEMINRGGEKIAPQEVDEALLEHPAVAEAVTFAVPHPTLGEDVAAAIVLWPHVMTEPDDLRHFVAERLADFKVPRQLLIVGEIPKGPTGKIQRIGLAEKLGVASHGAMLDRYVAPRTPLERGLAECWAEILKLERVGIHDNFFALGGDSLSVINALARMHEILNLEIEISRFFEAPTIAEMSQYLATMTKAGQEAPASLAIARAPQGDGAPTSISQERLCELHRVLSGLPFFNIVYALRLTSIVDPMILEQSVNEIVRRHNILQTTFALSGHRYIQVVAPGPRLRLCIDDLHTLPEAEKEAAGQRIIQKEALQEFNLLQGPLFRARLIQMDEREYILLLATHQVICDGWSFGIFVKELTELYDAFAVGKPCPLIPMPIQFADFAHWQRQWEAHPDVTAQLAYWREQLREPLPNMKLAAARPRRTLDNFHTAECKRALSPNLSDEIKRFSHREGGTLFMALVAALKILLHRYLGQEDIRVATLLANRNRPGTKSLIGPLVNTVILRTNLGGDPSLGEIMRRVRATILAAFAHQDLAFEELVEILAREHDLKAVALSHVMIVLNNATLRPIRGDGHMLMLEEANSTMLLPMVTATMFDLMFTIHEGNHGLMVSCVYKPSLFDAVAVDHLLGDFQSVLEKMVTQPYRPISAILVRPGMTA